MQELTKVEGKVVSETVVEDDLQKLAVPDGSEDVV